MAPTRQRQSVARPSDATASSSQRRGPIKLPDYQRLSHPLNANAQRSLNHLLQRHSLQHSKKHLKDAAVILSENVGAVNETLSVNEEKLRRRKARFAKKQSEGQENEDADVDGDGEDSDAAERGAIEKLEEELRVTRTKVESMTAIMDASIRKIIDGSHNLDHIEESSTLR